MEPLLKRILDEATTQTPPSANHHDTLSLRVASVFIIFGSSMLGGLPPLYVKAFKAKNSPHSLLLRAFSAGVILALALVHVAVDAWTDLGSLVKGYPSLGGVCILFGIATIAIIESGSHVFFHNLGAQSRCPCPSSESDIESKICEALLEVGDRPLRLKIMAYIFELGCIFHSVLIGVGLGVIVDDRTGVLSLMLALIFHQFLEGISLGNMVIRANFTPLKSLCMVVAYSVTTPVGILIGIGISATYNEHSHVAMAMQGVLNGVAAGMLLYIALVQLVAEDFVQSNSVLVNSPRLAVGVYVSFLLGATLMAMLSLWS